MNDTWNQLIAVLPPIIVSLTIVSVIASIVYRRHHGLAVMTSTVGLVIALVTLLPAISVAPIQVTPLFMVDGYTLFYWGIILLSALVTCIYAHSYLEGLDDNAGEFYIATVSSTLGAMALVASCHFASLFIGLELLSVPLYGMAAYAFRERISLEGGFKYMILSGAASSFLLFGMALLYAATGALNFEGLASTVTTGAVDERWILLGLGMIVVAFGFKMSLVPFHLWTPDVYEGAPAPAATYLSTVSKLAAFAVLMRFFVLAPVVDNVWLLDLVAVIAFLSMFGGNLLALRQTNMKRMLAYSSIAHLGYVLTALVALSPLSLDAAGVYLATYIACMLGAFGVVSLVSSPYGGHDASSYDDYRGLYWRRPVLAASMALFMISLAGIPLTMGFIGKFYILSVAMASQLWWLVAGIIIGSGMGLYYYLRVAAILFMDRPENARVLGHDHITGLRTGTVVIWILAVITVLVGIYPTPLINLIHIASIAAAG